MKKTKVRILASMAGDGFVWSPGDEIELPAGEAKRLIAAGFAVAMSKQPAASDPPVEPPVE